MQAAPIPASATPTAANDAAAPTATDKPKVKITPFGKARGEGAVPLPDVFGINGKDLLNGLVSAVSSLTKVEAATVAAKFDELNKSVFPGNKEGRTLYAVGRLVSNIVRDANFANEVRVPGDKKPRVKKTELFKKELERLAAAVPGGFEALKAQMSPEMVKLLGM